MKCKSWPEGEDEEAEVDVDNEAAQAKHGQLQGETLTNVFSVWIILMKYSNSP